MKRIVLSLFLVMATICVVSCTKDRPLPDGGSDTPAVDAETVETNSTAIAWASSTDDTYGNGFAASNNRLFVGYYKHTSTTTPVTANSDHIRIYKNSVIVVRGQSGKEIKKIVFNCLSGSGDTSFCSDMTGLESLPDASADKSANTITWTGSAAKVVLQASKGHVRITKLTVEFE